MPVTAPRTISATVFAAGLACAAAFGYMTGVSAQQTWKTLPEVVTGDNIGFRPAQEGSRVGTLVIRIDGQWVDAQLSAGPRMLPAK